MECLWKHACENTCIFVHKNVLLVCILTPSPAEGGRSATMEFGTLGKTNVFLFDNGLTKLALSSLGVYS